MGGERRAGVPDVHGAPAREQAHLIQAVIDGRARLVDRREHRASRVGKASKGVHHRLRLEGVEATGRLIHEDDRRVVDQLDPDGHAPALASRQPPHFGRAHQSIRTPHKVELGNRGLHARLPLGGRALIGQAQLGREHERLADRRERKERLVLLDVRRELRHVVLPQVVPVDEKPAEELRVLHLRHAACEHVEQRRLTGAARAHDRHHLPRLDAPTDTVQHELLRLLLAGLAHDVIQIDPREREPSRSALEVRARSGHQGGHHPWRRGEAGESVAPDVGGAEVPKIASSACKLLRKVQFKSSPVKSSQAAPLDSPALGMSGNQLRVLSIVPVTLIHFFNYFRQRPLPTPTVRLSRLTFGSDRHFTQVTKDDAGHC